MKAVATAVVLSSLFAGNAIGADGPEPK
jgi:hypothetical protein